MTKTRYLFILHQFKSPRRNGVIPIHPLSTTFKPLAFRNLESLKRTYSSPPSPISPSPLQNKPQENTDARKRMKVQFKCIAPSLAPLDPASDSKSQELTGTCGHLNSHEFSAQAFHHGLVLVQCPACLNRHLIADHLQWFTSNRTSDDPNFKNDYKTIIDIMKAKGESVKRGKLVNHSSSGTNSSSDSHQTRIHEAGHVLEFYQ